MLKVLITPIAVLVTEGISKLGSIELVPPAVDPLTTSFTIEHGTP